MCGVLQGRRASSRVGKLAFCSCCVQRSLDFVLCCGQELLTLRPAVGCVLFPLVVWLLVFVGRQLALFAKRLHLFVREAGWDWAVLDDESLNRRRF